MDRRVRKTGSILYIILSWKLVLSHTVVHFVKNFSPGWQNVHCFSVAYVIAFSNTQSKRGKREDVEQEEKAIRIRKWPEGKALSARFSSPSSAKSQLSLTLRRYMGQTSFLGLNFSLHEGTCRTYFTFKAFSRQTIYSSACFYEGVRPFCYL